MEFSTVDLDMDFFHFVVAYIVLVSSLELWLPGLLNFAQKCGTSETAFDQQENFLFSWVSYIITEF
jgi:hypothetical protein